MNPAALSVSFDLTGSRALVTGASSGLGRHFAATLAGAGAEVVLAARRVDALQQAVEDILARGGRARAVAMDVTQRLSVCQAIDSAGGPIDILVNNAGVAGTRRPLDYTDSDWDAIVGTNLKGAWMVAQEFSRRLVEAGKPGSIINITSILANRVAGGVSPYCASKAGLKHLTQALAMELARHGIRVNSLAPGYVVTELNRDFLEGRGGDKLKERNPMRRFGLPADLNGPLLLLASGAGAYITGAEIVVDGGHQCNSL